MLEEEEEEEEGEGDGRGGRGQIAKERGGKTRAIARTFFFYALRHEQRQ